jgi:hypothetical protein
MSNHTNSIIAGMFSSKDPVETIRGKQVAFSKSMDKLSEHTSVKDYSVSKPSAEPDAVKKRTQPKS